jgi:hypothetical protein
MISRFTSAAEAPAFNRAAVNAAIWSVVIDVSRCPAKYGVRWRSIRRFV